MKFFIGALAWSVFGVAMVWSRRMNKRQVEEEQELAEFRRIAERAKLREMQAAAARYEPHAFEELVP